MARVVVTEDRPEVEARCRHLDHGERLRLAIKQRGMSKLSAVAWAVGVTESAVSRWQKGGAMTTGNVATVCQRLDISADWLLLGRGNMDMHLTVAAGGFPQIARNLARLSPDARARLNHFLAALVDS